MTIKRKNIRLSHDLYKGRARASFTLCTQDKSALFTSDETVYVFTGMLKQALKDHSSNNWVYVFMPDHLHCIIEGNDDTADILKAMYAFKQRSGFWLSQNLPGHKWQSRFYDHIHRQNEDLKEHIAYILLNPVRKGLVVNWEDYPYLGSLDYILTDFVVGLGSTG